jgi:hypothetical protein
MKTKFDADLRALTLKAETGEVIHRTAIPTLVLTLDEDSCQDKLGPKLARLIWGGVGEDGRLLASSIKPSIMLGAHDVTIDGHVVRAFPAYDKVQVLKDRETVEVHVKTPFSLDRYAEAQKYLASRIGEGVEVAMEPAQQSLDLDCLVDREGMKVKLTKGTAKKAEELVSKAMSVQPGRLADG